MCWWSVVSRGGEFPIDIYSRGARFVPSHHAPSLNSTLTRAWWFSSHSRPASFANHASVCTAQFWRDRDLRSPAAKSGTSRPTRSGKLRESSTRSFSRFPCSVQMAKFLPSGETCSSGGQPSTSLNCVGPMSSATVKASLLPLAPPDVHMQQPKNGRSTIES
jgi:hypothetical protein